MQLRGAAATIARLRFDDETERAFEIAVLPVRLRDFTWIGLLALALYDAFIVIDRFAWPDVIAFAAIMRFGVVTPSGLALIAFARARPKSTASCEWTGAAFVAVAGGALDVMAAVSRAPHAVEGSIGLLVVFIFAGAVLRLRFIPALVATAAAYAGYVAVALTTPTFTTGSRVVGLAYVGASAAFSLFANWRYEHHERLAYLADMHERELSANLERQNAKLVELSETDPLTGIANRRAMTTRLDALMADRERISLSIFMIDIDHFKAYNDRYGHIAGDACIRSVATTIALVLRGRHDTIARYGGEELLAAVVDASPDTVARIAERMRGAVEDLAIASVGAQPYGRVTVSIGVARSDAEPHQIAAMIARADAELYRAKAAGRNCIGLDFARLPTVDGSAELLGARVDAR